LLDSAHAHQKSAEEHLEALRAHTRGLDAIVRDEIRRTLVEELQLLTAEINKALRALQSLGRVATRRTTLWSLGLAGATALIPGVLLWWVTPSTAELASLRSQREALSADLARLEAQGARVEWRRCGEAQRLCVRIERDAKPYGETGDFFIVRGR
jgi:chaperonin cofactor prefoldin